MTDLSRNITAHRDVASCGYHDVFEILHILSDQIGDLDYARRLLIAYAAHRGAHPPLHTLQELGDVTEISVSGVRTVYDDSDLVLLMDIIHAPASPPQAYPDINEKEVPW